MTIEPFPGVRSCFISLISLLKVLMSTGLLINSRSSLTLFKLIKAWRSVSFFVVGVAGSIPPYCGLHSQSHPPYHVFSQSATEPLGHFIRHSSPNNDSHSQCDCAVTGIVKNENKTKTNT